MKRLTINEVQSNLDLAISDRKKDVAVLEGKLKMEIELMKKDIQEVKQLNEQDHKQIQKDICEIKDMVQRALDSKANKWVETIMKLTIGTLITASIGIVVYLLQRHII